VYNHTMTSELITRIQKDRCAIARPRLIDGTLQEYLQEGLECITLCEYGSLRSPIAAEIATKKAFPTLFLIGGLKGLEENYGYEIFTQLIESINRTPHIAVILRTREVPYYSRVLPLLNYQIYENEGCFVELL